MFSCHLMVKVVHKFAATEARVKKVDLSCSLFTTQFALMTLFLLVATKKTGNAKKGPLSRRPFSFTAIGTLL